MLNQVSRVLIVGLGKSGLAAADSAKKNGAQVWLYDDNGVLSSQFGVRGFKTFEFSDSCLAGTAKSKTQGLNFDLVITSPGIAFNHQVLRLAAKQKWPVISEIEYAYLVLKPKFVIAVTGTNGKTTVVQLLDHIFKLSGRSYTVAGNIGMPLSSLLKVNDTLILELSSFQLHFIDKFRANVAAILNVTEDHMDWHCCFGQYLRDKLRIFKNQIEGDKAIVNIDDESLNGQLKVEKVERKNLSNGKAISFSTKKPSDYSLVDRYLQAYGQKVISVDDMLLKGSHNVANVLAAIACAAEAGVDLDVIREGIRTFSGLKHRLQFIDEINGVNFYNDSKSTNPDSTRKAIEAFSEPVILLMGGRNKGNNFSFLKDYIGNQISEVILFGEAAMQISEQIGSGIVVNTVQEALKISVERAQANDMVVFSPGCSSFDAFSNYAQRGDAFIEAVSGIKKLKIQR